MARSIISEGKTSTEAIEKGLKELGCKKEDVEIKVLEENKKALFSILDARVVKVELTVKENADTKTAEIVEKPKKIASKEEIELGKEKVTKFLDEFVKLFGNTEYTINENEGMLQIEFTGENASKLIGYRGDTINAMQNVLFAIANTENNTKVKISINIENYREKREKTLNNLARKIENQVKKTGRRVVLEPMTAYDRKILHTALQNSNSVTTYSIGEEPRRKVVVDVKK